MDEYWNNCEIRIDNKPVHYKAYYEAGIICTRAGLCRSIPTSLRGENWLPSISPLTFVIDNNIFDATKKKSKEFYALLFGKKSTTS